MEEKYNHITWKKMGLPTHKVSVVQEDGTEIEYGEIDKIYNQALEDVLKVLPENGTFDRQSTEGVIYAIKERIKSLKK